MFGDDDPEIASFFAKFLGNGVRRPPPATRRDGRLRPSRFSAVDAPISNGLALGLSGAAAILEDGSAPRVRVRSERTEAFHQQLEDMANDIMLHGTRVEVASSREPTPRSRPASPPLGPVGFTSHGEILGPLPQSLPPVEQNDPDEGPLKPDDLEDGSDEYESSEEDVPAVDLYPVTKKYPLQDFGQARPIQVVAAPSNSIIVSVDCNDRCIMSEIEVDLDSSLDELFARVEARVGKPIPVLISRHGLKLERAELPVKWSGLQSGDTITAVYHTHPPVEDRISPSRAKFQVISPSSSPNGKTSKLLSRVPNADPVSMGAFGNVIASATAAAGSATGAYPASGQVVSTNLFAPREGTEDEGDADDDAVDVPDHWQGGLGLAAAIQGGDLNFNLVPPVPPMPPIPPSSSEMWNSPECMPDEFEDLPADAFTDPLHQADGTDSALLMPLPQHRKVPASPPPTSATLGASTPTSSRLGAASVADTPSRRSPGLQTPGPARVDAEEMKKKMDEKQKANDAIWANIAASLEPSQKEPTGRSFMAQTASVGSFGKKLPPSLQARRLR